MPGFRLCRLCAHHYARRIRAKIRKTKLSAGNEVFPVKGLAAFGSQNSIIADRASTQHSI